MPKGITYKVLEVNTTGVSPGLALGESSVVGLLPASGWDDATGTYAAFEMSNDEGTTWFVVNDDGDGAPYVVPMTKGQFVAVNREKLLGVNHLRIRSANSTGTIAAQGAAVNIDVATMPIW